MFNFFKSDGMLFPHWFDSIFLPSYILGFVLGFFGGGIWILIGQAISLIIIYLFVKMFIRWLAYIYVMVKRKKVREGRILNKK